MSLEETALDNWIYTYYQGIRNGTYCVGRWVRLLYEYLVHGLEAREFFFNAKRANDAIDWIEHHCFHTEGPLAPSPIQLEVWQKAMVSAVYGIVDKDGRQQHREILFLVARKNGKSVLGGSVASYVWRTSGYGARVFCVSPKVEQSDIIYNSIWNMVQLDPEWQDLKEKSQQKDSQHRKIYDDTMLARHRQSDLAIPGLNSTVKKISYMSRDLNGYNPSVTICDEIASWTGEKGTKAYEVLRSAMGARPDSFIVACTTAGYTNDSIYDELMKRSTAFLLGNSKETKLLPFIYMIDDVEKWNDINELRKSNPNLGVSVSVDYLLEEIAIAEGSLSKKAEFMCKYCNIKQNSSQAWLDAQTVQKAITEPLRMEDFSGCYAVMGIDLSRTTDLTCATLVIQRDGVLHVFARFYLPREKIEEATARDGLPYRAYIQRGFLYESGDNFVDYRDIVEWVRQLITEYRIYPLMIGYDKYSASYMVQELKDGGCRVDDVFQGTNLTPIIRLTEGLLKDGKIKIGDNDLLKIHFLNSALKTDAENGRVKLIKMAQTAHVDGMAAFLDAMTVRDKWWPEIGAQLLNERR